MNNCTFVGKLLDDPVLEKNDGVSYCNFWIIIEEKKKKSVYLEFEIWDTGADALSCIANKDSTLLIECVAKNIDGPNEDETSTIFRVNKFKVFMSE